MILTHISKGVQDLQIHLEEGNKHAGPSCVHGRGRHNVLHIHTCINGCMPQCIYNDSFLFGIRSRSAIAKLSCCKSERPSRAQRLSEYVPVRSRLRTIPYARVRY